MKTSVSGSFVNAFGGRYYRIAHCDQLPPFFMNIVSSSDLWLFLASNGGLTAGRTSIEGALFPYLTVDRLYDSAGITGPVTACWVELEDGTRTLWQPLAPHGTSVHRVERNLYKSIEGDRVWFEEIHPALGLAFRSGWSTADDHGFVRRCELVNLGQRARRIRLLDGLRNLLPPGIVPKLQNESSCLADAYKAAELLPDSTLAVYALSAGIVDRAIPMESLRATVAWSAGLPSPTILLCDAQLPAFVAGEPITTEPRRRGRRAAYLACAEIDLAPGATHSWVVVADTNLSQASVVARRQFLATGKPTAAVDAAADASTQRLRALVGAADGHQAGADETATAHHFANVLFNVLRGGVFFPSGRVPTADFAALARLRNPVVAERHAPLLAALPSELEPAEFLARLAAAGDPQLERLGRDYLPLTFSRRHGDPSRPWNRFRIRVRDEHGRPVLAHEGNWRDIFQNWESLGVSHPAYLGGMVARFLNASTADGYNPYRITQAGIEWEVPDHEDPWASIGYWGDHQVIYLLKLLEWTERFQPDLVAGWLRSARFSYADVPYRIADYAAIRRQPRETITFDQARHREIEAAAKRLGTDARLIRDSAGEVRLANLTEKLLLLVATRLTNFVAEGGIWLNTQRPEWNDANNALVGNGLSVVTLCYLRRLIAHCRSALLPALGDAPVEIASSIATLTEQLLAILERERPLLATSPIAPSARRALLDALAEAGSAHRERVYRGSPGTPSPLAPAALRRLFELAQDFVDHSIRANRRADGLYHAYNLLEFSEQPPSLHVSHLQPMLEGQVAVLSSGLLSPAETLALLDALRRSPLYRADQHSYILYPDRELPGFLERAVLPADAATEEPLVAALLSAGDERLVLRDSAGALRFHPDLINDDALAARLKELAAEPRWSELVATHTPAVHALYERVFNHRAYTGRSGSMFAYEGLGSIYWHMVAKLLVAVQEYCLAPDVSDSERTQLAAHYADIRAGLGFNKTPEAYGAFPCDPYSHTPGHIGAQQPGMTGQVKEEILTRWGELGVHIERGCVAFRPQLLRAAEFTDGRRSFRFTDASGREQSLELPVGALGFTYCCVPIVYRRTSGAAGVKLTSVDGATREISGQALDAATSAALFARTGQIARIDVSLGDSFRPLA
ncbi:MAG TPA: hypothetical protein VK178_09450 [Opitutaceae bacterium]|nr:hypothetical protein [Opitutaceae bacterium]